MTTCQLAEYNTLAIALLSVAGRHDQARVYYERAADRADNLTDEGTAVRGIAGLDFAMGSLEEGRAQFERAVEVTGEYPSTAYFRGLTETETYLQWATYEISHGDCVHAERALKHAEEAASEENIFAVDGTMNARYQALLASPRC